MRKNKIYLILILVLFISIGFAYLSTNLFINGTSIVKRTTWDVHFNNIQNETSTSTIVSNATISSDSKSVDFEISFDKPGDSYSFNVDVVNNGNLDAMLESFDISGLRDDSSYLDWFVMYDDGVSLQKFDELKANTTEKLYITVIFDEDVDIDDLPTEYDASFTMKFTANYVQADNNANTRESRTYNITYNLDGGTITNNPTTYNSRSGAVIPNPTKEGYTFAGWTGGKNLFYNNYYESIVVDEYGDNYVGLHMIGAGNTIAYNQTRYECNKTYTFSSRSDLTNSRYLFRIRKLDDSDWMNSTDYTPPNDSWQYNQYYKGWWINNTDYYGNETIHIPEGLYWEFGLGFQSVPDLNGTTQYIYDIIIEENAESIGYEQYISEPITDIVLSPGANGNRIYNANWIAE